MQEEDWGGVGEGSGGVIEEKGGGNIELKKRIMTVQIQNEKKMARLQVEKKKGTKGRKRAKKNDLGVNSGSRK